MPATRGETFAPMQTVGGKLYGAPVPAAREGYTFAGWWVSMSNTADEITFRFEEPTGKTAGTLFTADTTLFAPAAEDRRRLRRSDGSAGGGCCRMGCGQRRRVHGSCHGTGRQRHGCRSAHDRYRVPAYL